MNDYFSLSFVFILIQYSFKYFRIDFFLYLPNELKFILKISNNDLHQQQKPKVLRKSLYFVL